MSASVPPDVIAAYDKALGAVGDRYDGLEDAVKVLADLVTQHPALAAATCPESPSALAEDVGQLVAWIEEFGIHISRLEMFPPVKDEPESAR